MRKQAYQAAGQTSARRAACPAEARVTAQSRASENDAGPEEPDGRPELRAEIWPEARRRAEAGLLANGGELGLLGSNEAYQQVWARDSMVCGLGLLLSGHQGREIHRRSLETLRAFQSPLGKIPHNVGFPNVPDPALIAIGGKLSSDSDPSPELQALEDTIHAGCVDGNLWYIIGHYCYSQSGSQAGATATADDTERVAFLREAWPSLEKALLWLRYQDSNECGLLEVHEAMDWADLFANRYNVLFDNVLYYAAWRCMGHMAQLLGERLEGDGPRTSGAEHYFEQAADLRRKLNTLLWVGPEAPKDWEWIASVRKEWLYPLRRVETELVERPFYLPYMSFRDYADRFDTLANLLAILMGVANETQANKILDYIHGCGLNEPYPVQALYPVIHPGAKDWRKYYRVRNLNQPHHYHNGGAWPFIGGFYVAALVRAGRLDEAQEQLHKLALMNREGRKRALGETHAALGETHAWEFNEWFHGMSGRPMGYSAQSWSMALYIYAHEAVRNAYETSKTEVPFLNF